MDLGKSQDIHTELLSQWYQLDHNVVDKVFQLLPITEHYPNYSSRNDELRAIDRDGWWKTFLDLQKTFWDLVKIAVKDGRMTSERAHVYIQSGKHYKVYIV